jgi:hypothetical protein
VATASRHFFGRPHSSAGGIIIIIIIIIILDGLSVMMTFSIYLGLGKARDTGGREDRPDAQDGRPSGPASAQGLKALTHPFSSFQSLGQMHK